MFKKILLGLVGVATAVTAWAQPGAADYPARPVKLIAVATAGAGGDVLARLMADRMGAILKTSFIVDNRPGAGGSLAMEGVARAAPDGYTIGLGGFTSNVLLPIVRKKMSYDPIKDFAPIAQIGTASILLAVTNDFAATDLKSLIALAKQNPKEGLLYASWGVGSTGHFCGELLNQRAGINTSHVPYKGTGPIVNDLLGGQIKMAYIDMATATPLVKSGRLRAIAACVKRSPSLPDVPSFEESGIDFSGKSALAPMWAFYAPAGTPQPVLDKLAAAMKQALDQPDMAAKLLELGVTKDYVPGAAYHALLAAGIPQWKEIATNSNIHVDE
ncbi:tripartite tricarboxylate transporter substrate binding protein [Xylophilus sp. GOD-11R]|uniref:Bug family tripartite tricarboxylate transporter substrate binding protein n=1 Tax=Xylophilus sp. GOD-11R TaxID=3089814 RepID=UPI00298CDA70|nr:tripartite tricarboxylate transporter substrate binding protein [Xylophilus sp. GOD-11R]WPB56071.1 tripartite tricarboxylate transporter substrate binding protein [Xylophilus sp. GOD-11R]